MQRHLPTYLAFVLATIGLLLIVASELLTTVALKNSGLQLAGLPTTYTWAAELSEHWDKWLIQTAHPINIVVYLGAPLAVVMAETSRTRWGILALIFALFALDLIFFVDTIQSPNNDRKGCEACFGSLLLHAAFAFPAILLVFASVAMRLARNAHVRTWRSTSLPLVAGRRAMTPRSPRQSYVREMPTVLRLISLALGCALTVTPSFLALQFAYGVGEPPEAESYFVFFGPLLAIGLLLGLGPLLIGVPRIVAGSRTPKATLFAGVLLAISVAGIVLIGFSGSITRIASPAILLIEVILFSIFIWPAKFYFAHPPLNPGASTSGAGS